MLNGCVRGEKRNVGKGIGRGVPRELPLVGSIWIREVSSRFGGPMVEPNIAVVMNVSNGCVLLMSLPETDTPGWFSEVVWELDHAEFEPVEEGPLRVGEISKRRLRKLRSLIQRLSNGKIPLASEMAITVGDYQGAFRIAWETCTDEGELSLMVHGAGGRVDYPESYCEPGCQRQRCAACAAKIRETTVLPSWYTLPAERKRK